MHKHIFPVSGRFQYSPRTPVVYYGTSMCTRAPTYISACPPVCPLLYAMRAHSMPYLAMQYHTRHGAAPPCIPVLPCGPLQLALRACITGTILRTIIGQYYKALGPTRGHPSPMALGLPPATYLSPYFLLITTLLFSSYLHIHFTSETA